MTLTLDVSQDYLTFDARESVIVHPTPRTDGTYFAVADALGRAPGYMEAAPTGGVYLRDDKVWHLPVATSNQTLLTEYPMLPGFVIEDSTGAEWTVLSVAFNTLKSMWRCASRNLVLAAALRDTITVWRPTITVGAGGEPVYGWPGTAIVTDLAASVRGGDQRVDTINDVESTIETFEVVLAQEVGFQAHDRIIWNGRMLQWEATRNRDRIDELPVVVAVSAA